MPGDTRPHIARRAKKARKAGSVEDVRLKLWNTLLRVEDVMQDEEDTAVVLKAAHAMTQGAAAYARIVEAGELEARLAALEEAMGQATTPATPLRKAA